MLVSAWREHVAVVARETVEVSWDVFGGAGVAPICGDAVVDRQN